MASKELAAKLQRRLASIDSASDSDVTSQPHASIPAEIPSAPPVPPTEPNQNEYVPPGQISDEQFVDIDQLISDAMHRKDKQHQNNRQQSGSVPTAATTNLDTNGVTPTVESSVESKPVWERNLQMKQSEPSSVRYDQNSSFVSKQQVNCTQEQSVATIRDPLNSDITNPSSISPANTPKCSAPIVPIVHHKGVPKVPQKQQSLDDSVTNRYVKEKNELEEKLAKQRQRKTSTPIVSEDVRQRNAISEDRMPPNSPPANSAILNGGSAFTKVGSAPPIAKIPNEDHVFIPICPSPTTKVPPPPPKKPSVSTMSNHPAAPLSPACSSTSNRSTGSEESDELAAKLARRNMIVEGEAVEPVKAPKVSVYTEFHEFSRKQIKFFTETFKRFDEDGDSFIDFNELKRMMEKLGEAQTHIALKGILKMVDEDCDGKVSLREFLLIFRYAATGQLSCSEVFNELAQSIDVTKEGVHTAAGFFQAKIDELAKSSKFEEEIKQEQEERKQLEEAKKIRKQSFLANKAVFSN